MHDDIRVIDSVHKHLFISKCVLHTEMHRYSGHGGKALPNTSDPNRQGPCAQSLQPVERGQIINRVQINNEQHHFRLKQMLSKNKTG